MTESDDRENPIRPSEHNITKCCACRISCRKHDLFEFSCFITHLGANYSVSLPVLVEVEVWPTHDEQPRQNMDEDPADPRRHRVRLWRPKMNVQNHHSHAYTEKRKPTLEGRPNFENSRSREGSRLRIFFSAHPNISGSLGRRRRPLSQIKGF